MARDYKITWNKNQLRQLNSSVRKYNNAIRRELKKHPLAKTYIPAEVKYKDLKARITNARALKNTVNQLNRITAKDAFVPVFQQDLSVTTKYARREYAIKKSVRERQKSRLRKINKGNPTRAKSVMELEPDKRKIDEISAKAITRFIETQQFWQNMMVSDLAQRYYSNYIDALHSVFGGFSEYEEAIFQIEEKIVELSKKDLDRLFNSINYSPSIKYIYDPIERDAKMNVLKEYWGNIK